MTHLPHFDQNKDFPQKNGLPHVYMYIEPELNAKNQKKIKDVTDGRTEMDRRAAGRSDGCTGEQITNHSTGGQKRLANLRL